MLRSPKPRYTYEQIMDWLYKESEGRYRLSTGTLSRYYNAVVKRELEEAERRTNFSMRLARQVAKAAKANSAEAMEQVILNVLDGAFMANEQAASSVDPSQLLHAKAALMRVQNQRHRLAIRERELEAQLEKHRFEQERLERELAKQRSEEERKRLAAEQALAGARPDDADSLRRAVSKIRQIYGQKTEAA